MDISEPRQSSFQTTRPLPLETAQAAPLFRQRRRLTILLCFMYVTFALVANSWGPIFAPLAAQLSLSLGQIGLLFVAWLIGYLPGAIVGGSLLDQYGPRLVVFGAFFLMIGGIGAIYLMVTFHLSWLASLAVCAGLAGIGGGTIDASTNGFLSSMYPQQQGTALNLFTGLYPLGATLISLLDGGFLSLFHNDTRPSFLLLLCCCLLALLLVVFLPKKLHTEQGECNQSQSKAFLSRLLFQGDRQLWRFFFPLSLAILLTTGFTATIRTWTPAYLHLTYGQTAAFAAVVSGIMNGLVLGFRLLVAVLVGRIGTRLTLLLALCLATLGVLGALGSQSNALGGTLALTVTALGLTPLVATFMALGTESVLRASGSITGLVLSLAGVSNILWSGIFGLALTRMGSTWALLSCLLPLMCSTPLVFRLRKMHFEAPGEAT
jgi:fucose permease